MFENMEIATYRVFTETANAVGDADTARVCQQICLEEEEMASWLADHLPAVTRANLSRADASRGEAKR